MVDVNYENWETIIGLEIHVQLNTKIENVRQRAVSFWQRA